jgi:patatin-like phospholipase/acyl hydrolase
MSAPNVAGVWIEGVGSTFSGRNNVIRASSDVAGAIVRGAVVTNGGAITGDNNDIAGTVTRNVQTPYFSEAEGTRLSASSTSGEPLNILSLDGGGVRGLSSLLILRKIMTQLRLKLSLDDDAQLHPCDFFDLICGTSTGGLIALMLGRLRMTVDDCIDAYVDLSREIFGKRNSFALLRRLGGWAQYSAHLLEEKMKNIIKSKLGDADAKMKDPLRNRCCRTFVAAIAQDCADAPPIKFRTYSTNEFLADNCTIWQAARATSAATTFFDPAKFGTPNITYIVNYAPCYFNAQK